MEVIINNVTKSYGFQKAVDNISFQVKNGEILGFLGPNGAGKTTTMKMITGYLEIDTGDITIDGKSVKAADMNRHIGYLPEHNPLYEDMPVINYLRYCGKLQLMSNEAIEQRVRKMVQRCGLDVEKHKNISELSKGYRQRVGLAQALLHDPDILILDEPTTGLDPNQIVEIRELIKEIGQEKTVLLSTHILPEVEATCDRIMIINRGKIVADGTADTLRKQAQGNQVLHTRIQAPDVSAVHERLIALPSVQAVDILNAGDMKFEVQSAGEQPVNEAIFRLCVDNGWVLTEMIPFETKLEDIFRDLTMN